MKILKTVIVAAPVTTMVLLVVWTELVYRISHYGSWHIYPALAVLPFTIVYHSVLIALNSPKRAYILYAVVQLILLIPIWFACLMLISKDSF